MKRRPHTLASLVRAARESMQLTIRDIETRSGRHISDAHFSQIENGVITAPSPRALRAISEILCLDYLELLILAGHLTKKDFH